MKLFYRIFKILAGIIVVITVTLFTASVIMQDKVAGIILRSFNKNISTKYEFGSLRLSFLRKFPKASLELKNVVVFSSPGYDKTCFEGINTDTLLSARAVTADFSIVDILKGKYNIERISVREGRLSLLTDTTGMVNYEISVSTGQKASGIFNLNLDRINISNLRATYNNLATELLIEGIVDNGRIYSRISGDNIDFTAEGQLRIDLFRLYDFKIYNSIAAEIDVNLHSSEKGTLFNKSSLVLNKYLFGLTGFVSSDDVVDLTLNGNNLDISIIKDYLPEKYLVKIADYNPSGVLNITGNVKGPVSRTINPGINIDFNVEKGNISYVTSALNIKDLTFKGSFTNGPGMVPETSSLSINDFSGILGSSKYTGSLLLSDFDRLRGRLYLKGKVIPAEIKEFFNLKDISTAEGSIDLDLKMEGLIPEKEKYTLFDLFSLSPVADIEFHSFDIGIRNDKVLVNNVNGHLLFSDTVVSRNLKFTIKDQNFLLNGVFMDLPGWLAGEPVILSGSADISCSNLKPEELFARQAPSENISEKRNAYQFPGGVILDVNFRIEDLVYKTFEAKNIAGSLSYKPGIINFKTLNLNSLDGVISGNGFIAQNRDKTFIGRGSFTLARINVNKAFSSFKNFGQDFLKAENLAGTLSGSLSLLLPMDSLFRPVYKSITAEGKYVLTEGSLINFEPVKELSSFIELSELENINFDKLENDFFIRNNFVYIPQMDVKSSAADLAVNGKHSLDNSYEYHVRILLSEILSRKIRKPKPNTTEFGAVQDDGLGRTSLLLKIESRGDDVKVSYDLKAAGSQVKGEMKSERQNLKTILNQEYGWYKNDTTVTQAKPADSRRFRISWEETDSVKVETEQPVEKKESGIKNIFKKK